MADISGLGSLQPVEQLDLGNYAENKPKSFQLAPKGRYTLQAPASFPTEAYTRSKSGALNIQIDPKIVGGPADGTVVKFQRISAATWKRDGKAVSKVGDYLKAIGSNATLTNEQDIADAVEATANLTYDAILDWKAGGYGKAIDVEGMEKFPKNEDGSYQSWIEHPTETITLNNGTVAPKRVFANLYVRDFVPQGA